MGKLKNRKATGKNEVTGDLKKGWCDRVVDWIWRLWNIDFGSCIVPEDWRFTVIVPMSKGKGDGTEFINYYC